MRRVGFLVMSAALVLFAPSVPAQQAPPASTPFRSPDPWVEPPYDANAHGGLAEGVWLRMSRGTGRRSTGMMATGIVLVGLGVVFMGTGTAVHAIKASCRTDVPLPSGGPGSSFPQRCSQESAHLTGLAILVAGSIGVALGIPLWAIGASDVPRAEAAENRARPTLVAVPGGAGLAWRF